MNTENIFLRSIKAIINANNKANALIELKMDPPEEQDELQHCLFAFLMDHVDNTMWDDFIIDVYAVDANAQDIVNTYFVNETINL